MKKYVYPFLFFGFLSISLSAHAENIEYSLTSQIENDATREKFQPDSHIAKAYVSKKYKTTSEAAKSFPNFIQPINPKYYVAFGGVISSKLASKDTRTVYTEKADARDTEKITYKQNLPGIGFTGIVGYSLNPIVSFELYYSEFVWRQKSTLAETYTTNALNNSTKLVYHIRQLDFGPRSLLFIPLTNYFSPYFIFGLTTKSVTIRTNYSKDQSQPTKNTEKKTRWDISYAQGFGIQSQFTKNFGMRLEVYTPFFINEGSHANLITYWAF